MKRENVQRAISLTLLLAVMISLGSCSSHNGTYVLKSARVAGISVDLSNLEGLGIASDFAVEIKGDSLILTNDAKTTTYTIEIEDDKFTIEFLYFDFDFTFVDKETLEADLGVATLVFKKQ